MSVAYLDTSVLVSIAFGEPEAPSLIERLGRYEVLATANLLEAEYASALQREGVQGAEDLLEGLSWVLPDRRLTAEIVRSVAAGKLRGADLWHVAAALYLAESPRDVDFLTLDATQREVASALGFGTPL